MNNSNILTSQSSMPVENIGFGCVALTSISTETKAINILETAFANGITHFDTAPLYGQGYSEKILGKFMKMKRDSVTITTKFGLTPAQVKKIPVWMALPLNNLRKKISGQSAKPHQHVKTKAVKLAYRKILLADVEKDLNSSLQRLKTGYIDYYILHEGMPSFLEEGVHEFLNEKMGKGVIRNIGIGCDFINFRDEKSEVFKNWNVLQYGCESILTNKEGHLSFPDLMHIQHSVFKNINKALLKGQAGNDIAGAALALAIKNNPGGKILFSTSKPAHLENNLKALNRQMALNEKELNEILSHAIY